MSEFKPSGPTEGTSPTETSKSWKTFFDPNTRILEIRISGTVDLDTLHAMTKSTSAEADILNPLGILADYSSARVELGFDEIFGLPARAPEFGINADFPVAIIANDRSLEEAHFAEDVFSNRGYIYKAFRHKDSAVEWLLEMARAGGVSWAHG